jgi:rhodanese-related sulfurtransferase
MRGTGFRALILLVGATAAAVTANIVRPNPLPWVIDPTKSTNPGKNPGLRERAQIGPDEFLEHIRNGTATIVDARKPDEFSAGHVAGAINIPSMEKEQYLGRAMQMLPPEGLIVIYCGGGACEASNEVFEFLVGSGFRQENLRLFEPGWEWIGKQPDAPILLGVE